MLRNLLFVVLLLSTPYVFPYIFILGTIVGSFLNVVALRHEKKETLTGRSYCPHCTKKLSWYELIPLFSWIFQRGKCRGCKASISIQYPLVELLTGTVFVLVASVHYPFAVLTPELLTFVLHLVVWSILIVITVYDFRTKLVPDRFSFSFAALAFVLFLLEFATVQSSTTDFLILTTHFLAGPLLFAPFFILWFVSSGRWIGLGDGKLAVGIGWLLGLVGGLSAILFAFWLGALVGLTLIAIQHLARLSYVRRVYSLFVSYLPLPFVTNTTRLSDTKKGLTLKSEVPFAPFMVLGSAIVYFTNLTILSIF